MVAEDNCVLSLCEILIIANGSWKHQLQFSFSSVQVITNYNIFKFGVCSDINNIPINKEI